MMRVWSQKLSSVFVASLAIILALLPWHAFLSTWGGTAVGPLLVWKSWKEILLLALVPLAICYCVLRPDVFTVLWSRLINKLIAGYFVLSVLLALFSQASHEAVIAGLLIDLRFFACFVLTQLIVASKNPWVEKLKAWIPNWLLCTGIVLSIFSILQVTVLPHDFLTHFGYNKDATISPISTVDNKSNVLRAFATMRGPNTLGAYLVIPLALALYFVIKKRQIVLAASALGLGLVALLLTDSRSAWLGFIATATLVLLYVLPRAKLVKWAKRLAVPAILAVGIVLAAATTVPSLRLAIFHSSASDVNPALLAGSSDAHWQATLAGITYIAAHPLGTGIGSAGPASFYNAKAAPLISEDYFVQIGEEVGILGLLLFLAINFLAAQYLLKTRTPASYLLLASFVGLSIISIFLHGWADDPTAMTWWALAGFYIFDKQEKS